MSSLHPAFKDTSFDGLDYSSSHQVAHSGQTVNRLQIVKIRSLEEGIDAATKLHSPGLLVIDVEPAVVAWSDNSGTIIPAAERLARQISPQQSFVLCTNSRRFTHERLPGSIKIIHRAWKPFTSMGTTRAKAVLGDTLITDGLLAWRLGACFLFLEIDSSSAPLIARTQKSLGKAIEFLLRTIGAIRT